MPSLLILSYFFPPLGGAGTQRWAKFARWLPDFGYQPVVVAASPGERPATVPAEDHSLAEEIGPDTVLLRVPRFGRRPSLPRRLALAARFRIDDEEWVARALPVIEEAILSHSPAAAVISVSPYAAALLGPVLARRFKLPWALDLRDPWVLDGWYVPTTKLHEIVDRRRMRRLLQAAGLVIANTPAARHAYMELADLPEEKVWTIPNGYDPADFPPPSPPPEEGRFILVHVGCLHSVVPPQPGTLRRTLRARRETLDHTGRSGRYLFQAVALLKERRPDLYASLQLELCGQLHPSHHALASQLGIASALKVIPYLPHRQAVARMVRGHAVFIPLHALPAGRRALIVPGKTYEALATGRYILGCLPEGDAADLIRKTGAGAVCPPDNPDRIADCLIDLLSKWHLGRPRPGADPDFLAPFTRRNLTARLAQAIDALRDNLRLSQPPDPWQTLESPPQPATA